MTDLCAICLSYSTLPFAYKNQIISLNQDKLNQEGEQVLLHYNEHTDLQYLSMSLLVQYCNWIYFYSLDLKNVSQIYIHHRFVIL